MEQIIKIWNKRLHFSKYDKNMNFNKIILLLVFLLKLSACADYKTTRTIPNDQKQFYSSSGFVLIYEDNLYDEKIVNRKLDNEDLLVMHSILKRNTPVKIMNPNNSKVVETIIYKKANYPKIFNMVIS